MLGQQQQRARHVLSPFDNAERNHSVFRSPRYSAISLETLTQEDAIEHKLNFKYLDLQLLRIVTPSVQSGAGANVYYRRQQQNATVRFIRIFLCRVISSTTNVQDSSKLVYIMEATNQNNRLWLRNCNFRDNGAITIGSFFRFITPLPSTSRMHGDIPLLESRVPAILLKRPTRIPSIAINQQIETNDSRAFVYNNATLSILQSNAEKTSCYGRHCDRQRVFDWNGKKGKGCGCYSGLRNSSSLVIQHFIRMSTIADGNLEMMDFSSLKFQKLFLKGDIPGSCKLFQLHTDAFDQMILQTEECVDKINLNDGFTVIGWYKRGSINDRGQQANRDNGGNNGFNNNVEAAQIEGGEISYHIVEILPTNQDFLDENSTLGTELNELKFDQTLFNNVI